MNAIGPPGDNLNRQAFLDGLVNGDAADLQLCPGIKLCATKAGTHQGLSLHIAREALHARQLQRVLQRRFEQAVAFEGYFAYLDALGSLVIWHALPAQRAAVDSTLSRMLSLASLEELDRPMLR